MARSISREDEIGRIDHELENLLSRYRALEDVVWWLKLGFSAFVAALIAMAAFAAVIDKPAMFLLAIGTLVLAALAALAGPIDWSGHSVRWIDFVGWQPGALGINIKRSEAMAIEDMIAERLRLRAQLREPSEGTAGRPSVPTIKY